MGNMKEILKEIQMSKKQDIAFKMILKSLKRKNLVNIDCKQKRSEWRSLKSEFQMTYFAISEHLGLGWV